MVDRIIRFLNGITHEELATIHKRQLELDIITYQRYLAEKNEEREYYQHELDKKNIEIQRLTNLILVEHGVIREKVPLVQNDGPKKPIQRHPSMQSVLERARVKDANDHAEMLKKRWSKDSVISSESIKKMEEEIGLEIPQDIAQDMKDLV